MFIRKRKNKSGTTSVVIIDKSEGFKTLHTIGVSSDPDEIEKLVLKGQDWINQHLGQEVLDFESKELSHDQILQFLDQIDNVLINGTQLIIDRVFERIGFDQIKDEVLRNLVISRLTFPSSKAATSDYLRFYFDEDVHLSKIYRYLDKLNSGEKQRVEQISVAHTRKLLGEMMNVVFYDVTTLYFETDHEDDLRRTGFSKEGKHSHPQILLGVLVSRGGYPLAYCIHEGNKYEGHTMLAVVEEFVRKYDLKKVVIVADSGLLNKNNLAELDRLGYEYIIGARIKNETQEIIEKILSWSKLEGAFYTIEKGANQRLVVGYRESRRKKDALNRDKGVKRLEKAYKRGNLTKEHVNKRGYNKFLDITKNVDISINYARVEEDRKWDGLKGYVTNTDLPVQEIHDAYQQLWQIENAFRVTKSKLEIRPIFHFTKRRIEAHICICFIALKVYKELERILRLSNMPLSVDKVIQISKTITTIVMKLPNSNQTISKTMLLKRHKIIEPLFQDDFWVRFR